METRKIIALVGVFSLLPFACNAESSPKPFGRIYFSVKSEGRTLESRGIGFVAIKKDVLVTAKHVATRMETLPAPAESLMFFPANTKDTIWARFIKIIDDDAVIYHLKKEISCEPFSFADSIIQGQFAYSFHIDGNRVVEDSHLIIGYAASQPNNKSRPNFLLEGCGETKEGDSGGMILDKNREVIGLLKGCGFSKNKPYLVCRVFKFRIDR